MKRIICFFLGYNWAAYKGDFLKPYCARCGQHTTLEQIVKNASGK